MRAHLTDLSRYPPLCKVTGERSEDDAVDEGQKIQKMSCTVIVHGVDE
jgi:hypothetical protein